MINIDLFNNISNVKFVNDYSQVIFVLLLPTVISDPNDSILDLHIFYNILLGKVLIKTLTQ